MTSARFSGWVPAVLALAILAGPLAGAARAAEEDYEFGQGLLERRWYDLAEKVFRELGKKGVSTELRNKGELGLINVLKTRAENEENADEKKKLFDEAISKYKNFLEGKSDPQALFNLAELLKSKGVDFTNEIKIAEEEEKKKELVKEAHTAFKEAVSLVKDFLDKIRDRMKSKGIDVDELTEDERTQLRNAMFNHADLHYLMAQVFEGSREKKVEILRKSVELFEEFIWDFEDFGQAYLAYIQTGRCYVEMEEYGEALDQYNNVLLVPLPQGASASQKQMRDRLRIMAYYRILEALVLAKKYKIGLERCEDMEREYPELIEKGFADPLSGRAAILEKAKALAGLGQISEAISEAVRVVDKGGWFMQVGMKLLGDWVAQDPKAGVRIVLLQAEGLYRTMKLHRAVTAYQNAIDKIDTKDKLMEFGPQAWADMAQVYASREMYYEAGLAFLEGERIAQIFVQGMGKTSLRDEKLKKLWDQGSECSYKAYRAFKLAWEGTRSGKKGSDHLKKLYSDQRTGLTRSYADSVYAKNLQFFAGQDLLRQGKYLDAVVNFQGVDPASDFFETSLVGIGQAYFKEYDARREKAEKKAKDTPDGKPREVVISADTKKYLDKAMASFDAFKKRTTEKKAEGDEAEARRKTLFSYTDFFMARIYNEREDWKKVIETLEGFEDEYKDKPDLVLTAVFLKLQSFFKIKRARSVEDMLRIMEEVDETLQAQDRSRTKKHIYLIIGYQLAGAIYGELAVDAKKKRELETYREYNEKAAEYLWIWIKNDILADLGSSDPSRVVGRLDAVGIKLFKAREFEKAGRIYETILIKLGSQLNPDSQLRFKRKMGDCYIELEEWEKALDIFKEVYEAKKMELFLEKLVLIYTMLGDKFSDAGDVKNANINYDEALKLYNIVLRKDQPEKRQWWVWKLAVWGIIFKKGQHTQVVRQITNAQLLYPTLGGPKLLKDILELQDQAKELAGSRRKKKEND